MDYVSVLYLAAFPVISAIVGWILLAHGLRKGMVERWGLIRLSVWRYVLAYGSYVTAWLVIVAMCVYLFSRAADKVTDHFALIAVFSLLAWLGCGAYWSLLSWCAERVVGLPTTSARQVASSTLLWNLILTLPYAFMAIPYTKQLS